MALNPSRIDTEGSAFSTSDVAMSRHGNGPSQRTVWRKGRLSLPHWNKPRWVLFVLLVFAGNVFVATIAWIIVRLVTG
jgi:hypothetical protein